MKDQKRINVLEIVLFNEGTTYEEYIRIGYIIGEYSWGEKFIKPCTWNQKGICSERGRDADIEAIPAKEHSQMIHEEKDSTFMNQSRKIHSLFSNIIRQIHGK